jgi:hypothetical protein
VNHQTHAALTNTASVGGNQFDPNPVNNIATVTTNVIGT